MIDLERNCQIMELPTGGFEYHWYDNDVRIVVSHLQQNHHRNIFAELHIETPPGEQVIGPTNLNLTSRQERLKLILDLAATYHYKVIKWDDYIEYAALNAILKYRQGEPAIKINDIPTDQKSTYLLHPIIVKDELTLLYGKGGKGKSALACFIAVLIQDGISDAGLTPLPGNVLYLDWEQDQSTVKKRVTAIRNTLNSPQGDNDILYRRCQLALVDELETIQNIMLGNAIDLVIIDGYGYAIGGDTQKEERVLQTIGAIRQLNCTILVIDHEAKTSDGETPFGSVYKYNAARSIFYLKGEENGSSLEIALIHKKRNDGKRLEPLGYEFTFITDPADPEILLGLRVKDTEASNIPGLESNIPVWRRMSNLLTTEGPMTIKDIAESLSESQATIRAEISRREYHGKKVFIKLENHKYGVSTFDDNN